MRQFVSPSIKMSFYGEHSGNDIGNSNNYSYNFSRNSNRHFSNRGQAFAQGSNKRLFHKNDYGKSGFTQKNRVQREPLSQHGDSKYQLWMGDLEPTWDENAIMQIWEIFGETPVSVKLIRDKFSDKPKGKVNAGYCFVSFSSQKGVSSAILKNGLQIPGSVRTLKLNWASGSNYSGQPDDLGSKTTKNINDFSVFVGDLATEVTDTMLFDAFNKEFPNEIKQAKIMMDPVTRLSKGFGFVRFTNGLVQQKALNEMTGYRISSRQIRVGAAVNSANNFNQSNILKPEPALTNIQIPQLQPQLNAFTDPDNTTIRVHGLASKFSETDIRLIFISFGHIVYCRLTADLNSAYIKFLFRQDAELAILYMYGANIKNCRLKVNWGASATTELETTRFVPLTNDYKKQPTPPLLYGYYKPYNLCFDQLSEAQFKDISLKHHDRSDLLPSDKINEDYVTQKLYRDDLLNTLYF